MKQIKQPFSGRWGTDFKHRHATFFKYNVKRQTLGCSRVVFNFWCILKNVCSYQTVSCLNTARKVSVFEVFLVRIFPRSDRIQRDTEYLFVFSPNTGKYRPGKLRIRTRFPQYKTLLDIYDEAFCKNSERPLVVNYFLKKNIILDVWWGLGITFGGSLCFS